MAVLSTRLGQWLALMGLLIALLTGLAVSGAVTPVEDAALTVFGPVQRALRHAAEPVADLISNIDDFDAVDDENSALRNRVAQLEAENTRLREEQIEVRGREALIAVQEANAGEIFVTADVITRDLTGLRDIIGIDRGANDGIETGMPVLAEGGALVGVIIETRNHVSFIRLITDPATSIRGIHQLTRTEGIINGDTEGDLLVDFIPQAVDVQPGQTFITSGLGGLLPAGIPVGTVTSAEGSAQEVFRRIRLRPLAPLEKLEQILVQVTFIPEPISVSDRLEEGAEPGTEAGKVSTP